MNLIGEVRDVTPEIMGTFATEDSRKTRDTAFKELESRVLRHESIWGQLDRSQKRNVKEEWESRHPLGYVEYLHALGPDGDYGRWLRELPFALIVDDILFLHAGITPELADWGVDGLNSRVATEVGAFDAYRRRLVERKRITSFANLSELLSGAARETEGIDWLPPYEAPLGEPPPLHADLAAVGQERERFQSLFHLNSWFLSAPEGPLWFRGYARWDEAEGTPQAAALLDALGVRAIVVGHTPQQNGIRARFGSRVFLIDTGMLTSVYGGEAMALVIEGDTFTILRHDGGRVQLPSPPPRSAASRPTDAR
jgi:hypothetical protein